MPLHIITETFEDEVMCMFSLFWLVHFSPSLQKEKIHFQKDFRHLFSRGREFLALADSAGTIICLLQFQNQAMKILWHITSTQTVNWNCDQSHLKSEHPACYSVRSFNRHVTNSVLRFQDFSLLAVFLTATSDPLKRISKHDPNLSQCMNTAPSRGN